MYWCRLERIVAMNPMVLSSVRHTVLVECLAQKAIPVAQSKYFTLYNLNLAGQNTGRFSDTIVVHHFTPSQIDNNISSSVANELLPLVATVVFADTFYSEQEIFERYVGAIVRSVDGDERHTWNLFYTNTLQRMFRHAPADTNVAPDDFIGTFGAIYRHACHLIADAPEAHTVLDVATCFGFFSFFLSGTTSQRTGGPDRIVGCDLNPALMHLASDYARQQQIDHVEFVVANILAHDITFLHASFQAASFDVVTAIHLLEHLEESQMAQAINNLWQLTRQRLIIAVPLEEVPDARFGHVQAFDRDKLLALGQAIDGTCQCFEYRGGWLVIDRHETRDLPAERLFTMAEQRSSIL